MACGFNTPAKILVCIGVLSCIIGGVFWVVADAAAKNSQKVDFVTQNSKSFEIQVARQTLANNISWGFKFLVEGKTSCPNAWQTLKVTIPSGQTLDFGARNFSMFFSDDCVLPREEWMTDHEPPLQPFAHFFAPVDDNLTTIQGTYAGECDFGVWIVDSEKEATEAFTGIFKAFALWLTALAFLIVGIILLCVSCCCCCCAEQSRDSGISKE
eukprot:CAMPEP_0117485638 /NCGR_PEP_ID=MMETSP0784-20121206/15067_1 /TAXON_ID=39447 /ORGANISM="" /LENGTH=211 /DNA_ID=CAMNT_0005280229 /DNA_START=98 /DNA_END=733 /DNA_ORIENTATION=-